MPGHNPVHRRAGQREAPMTQGRIELTPEELAELAENSPQLLEAIEKGNPVAAPWLASWRSKRSVCEEAQEQSAEVRKEVASAVEASSPEQVSLVQWCGFPTDMTRCSPFFPMKPNELGHREFLRDFIITSANWGEIKYTGPKLSTYEEDVLMVLLAVLDDQSQHRRIDPIIEIADGKVTERKSYTYKGPAWPLLRLLGYKKPGKDAYKRLISALELMGVAGVKLCISDGKTKGGKRRSPRITQLTTMLACVLWDDKEKILRATVNPFFYETYMAGRVTLMDVAKRIGLKGNIAKSLYRFVQSHRQNPVFVGHFLTLADALNMDREQPAKEIRRSLKTAINELVRQGVLMKKSGFVDTDIIKLNRAMEALPNQEKKNH